MSTSGGDIEFTFRGNAAQLMGELRKIDGGIKDTAAKAAPSVGKVKTAMDATAKSAGTAAQSFGAVGSASTKLAGALGMVSPALANVARGVADLADVGEVASSVSRFGGAVASLAPILLTVGGAFYAFTEVIDDYTSSKKEATRATVLFADALKPLDDALASARAENALLNQAQSEGKDALEEYAKVADIHAQADAKVAEATKAHREEREKLAKTVAEASNQSSFDVMLAKERIKKIDEEIAAIEGKGRELKGLTEDSYRLRDSIDASTRSTEKGTRATEDATKATDAQREADAAYLAMIERKMAASQQYAALLDEERSTLQALVDDRLTGVAAVDAAERGALQAEMDRYVEAREAARAANENIEELERIHQANLAIIREQANADRFQAQVDADIASAKQQAAADEVELEQWQTKLGEKLADVDAYVSATSSLFGSLSAVYALQADALAAEGGRGAEEAFIASQAFAVAQAGVSTALAVLNALATVPYPAAPVAAVAAGVAGAAQLAAILATPPPSRHGGGALYPDEAMVKMRAGESALTPEATARMGGPGGVAAFNAGSGGMGGSLSVRVGRHVFREAIRTDIRAGGIVTQEIDRRVARSSLGAGVSGKTALA